MEHQSSWHEQRAAEPVILAGAAAQLGVHLDPVTLNLPGGARVDIDGSSADRSVLVEVFSHQGRLRGAQFHKVARDALKLITIARDHPGTRLAVVFGDSEAAACVTGRSWLSEALRAWGIEVLVVDIDDELRRALGVAQIRQRMVNPAADENGQV